MDNWRWISKLGYDADRVYTKAVCRHCDHVTTLVTDAHGKPLDHVANGLCASCEWAQLTSVTGV